VPSCKRRLLVGRDQRPLQVHDDTCQDPRRKVPNVAMRIAIDDLGDRAMQFHVLERQVLGEDTGVPDPLERSDDIGTGSDWLGVAVGAGCHKGQETREQEHDSG
jgi:hypothetical protein